MNTPMRMKSDLAQVGKGRVLVAMSGGVDSSVTAALLVEQGYECIGATMQIWPSYLPAGGGEGGCCSLAAVEDARRIAFRLGIPYYVVNFQESFQEKVIDKFCRSYQAGRTPNPCIDCNREIKWEALLLRARELDCDFIATGHYARVGFDETRGRHVIRKGLDRSKDQSYVLYNLTQEQLARTLLPLGGITKDHVRSMARERGLPVADKPDSQEICFIPDNDYRGFLKEHAPQAVSPGPILDLAGREIGRHEGIAFFTIGQRKGLGITSPEPLFVIDIDPGRNAVVVGEASALGRSTFVCEDVNWVALDGPVDPFSAEVQVRYSKGGAPATIEPTGANQARVRFDQPVRAVTPGQAAVFYEDDVVLGGGVISAVEK